MSEANVDLIPIIRECHRVLTRREWIRKRERARRGFETEHRLPARGTADRRRYVVKRILELAPPLIAQGLSNRKIARKLAREVGSLERTVRRTLGQPQRQGGF